MRKLFVFAFIFLVIPAHGDYGFELSSGTSYFVNCSSKTWASESSLMFMDGSANKKAVLVIDGDGDIFLRGKWIGWDGRLDAKHRMKWGW